VLYPIDRPLKAGAAREPPLQYFSNQIKAIVKSFSDCRFFIVGAQLAVPTNSTGIETRPVQYLISFGKRYK
jgi:hypothetical protein